MLGRYLILETSGENLKRCLRFPEKYDLYVYESALSINRVPENFNVVDRPWVFGQFVGSVPHASVDLDFDGVCIGIAVRPITSWSVNSVLYKRYTHMIPNKRCEATLIRNLRRYICTGNLQEEEGVKVDEVSTVFALPHLSFPPCLRLFRCSFIDCQETGIRYQLHLLRESADSGGMVSHNVANLAIEKKNGLVRLVKKHIFTKYGRKVAASAVSFRPAVRGGGLICHETGDPVEDRDSGVLVGVHSL
ncbi:hypothetical protein EVAR_27646_1 [Eumeta japonica]|uniref:Uncharacterized protein n=1 Tax=Eumeta variegata TaxID=151549 RepID=A0A4C1V1Q9_EUMVA|nr:hypothetical protein EVAR_27646_1 [Eumeta japonica]